MRNLKTDMARWLAYFRRGHSAYLNYGWWGLNTVTIIYVLLATETPILREIFPSIVTFGLTFAVLYFFLATLVGREDYKRGSWKAEASISFSNNPEWIEVKETVSNIHDMVLEIKKYIDEVEVEEFEGTWPVVFL